MVDTIDRIRDILYPLERTDRIQGVGKRNDAVRRDRSGQDKEKPADDKKGRGERVDSRV